MTAISNSQTRLNQTSPNQISHNKQRFFKPEVLKAPRDFVVPDPIHHLLADSKDFTSRDALTHHKPLVVEIGAGKGMHACEYAKQNPQHNIIAIERTANKFMAFKGLIESMAKEAVLLDNLFAVHADAIPYCVFAIPPKSVSAFYILYPNPEPKNPNQQWLNMPFYEFLLSRLVDAGKIILVSNIREYIENAYLQSIDTWRLKTLKTIVPNDSQRTHFEIKYLARGETCWELTMIKPESYQTRFDSWVSPKIAN